MLSNPPAMRLWCTLDRGGYGYAARGLVQALKSIGVTSKHLRVVPSITNSPAVEDVAEDTWLNPYLYGEWKGDDRINIVHLNPALVGAYHTGVGGRYNIAYCAWETKQLPKAAYTRVGESRTVVQDLNDYDEIWVPTKHLVEVFIRSGVTKPIYVIPHALTEQVLRIPAKKDPPLPSAGVGFYFVGSWNPRKNPEGLLRAYWGTQWTIAEPALLSLQLTSPDRTPTSVETHSWLVGQRVQELRELLVAPQDGPRLALLTTPRSYAWVLQLHQNNHVFVTASRGEGFCLPALEAVALGNYVIGGGGPALEDLAALAPSAVALLPRAEVPITPMPEYRGYELDQTWWDTSFNDLTLEIQSVYTFIREEGMARTDEIEAVREAYSPVAVGRIVEKRLEHAIGVVESSGW